MGRVQPLPDAVAVTSLVLATTGGVLTAVAIGDVLTALLQSVAYSLAFGAVGWVLWRRLPANPIGWCFSGSALASAVSWPGHGWAALAMTGRDGWSTPPSATSAPWWTPTSGSWPQC